VVTPLWEGCPPLGAVVDLDDTLYPQAEYLAGAVSAVAARTGELGLDAGAMNEALTAAMVAGSDKGGTIDRALTALGQGPDEVAALVPDLVEVFARFRPLRLSCYPGAMKALAELRDRLPVVCLTDGDPRIQQAKLAALGLTDGFTAVVITDSLGGKAMRKPNPAGMARAGQLIGLAPERLIVIGDRPAKDVAVAAASGARAIRVRQGEYAAAPDWPPPWASAADFPAAVDLVMAVLDRPMAHRH
jgi:FMN phosphatase YigB (HAD superfamily)